LFANFVAFSFCLFDENNWSVTKDYMVLFIPSICICFDIRC